MIHSPRGVRISFLCICLSGLYCWGQGREYGSYEHPQAIQEQADALLKKAGNTSDDRQRISLLRELAQVKGLSDSFYRDLMQVTYVAEVWVNAQDREEAFVRAAQAEGGQIGRDRGGYLYRYFGMNPAKTERFLPKLPDDSPLVPLLCIYEGRIRLWIPIEMGRIQNSPYEPDEWYARAKQCLELAHQAYPENRIVGMYLGKPLPWPVEYRSDAAAPEWANLQRECLEKLTDIIHWWIDNRMIANGQFGGGWNDDCEMWRWWAPVLVGFDDPKIVSAQETFCESLMSQPHMKGGYTNHIYDVEHTAEDSTDSILPMMFLKPEDPVWQNRTRRVAELMKQQWMGWNDRGFWQFKSAYFSSEEVDLRENHSCDTPYHIHAVMPVLALWQRTGNAELGALIRDWMGAWVDAAERTDGGKPSGVLPAALHWPDGRTVGYGPDWRLPEIFDQSYYDWPSMQSELANALVLTWHMTGEEKYLTPIRTMSAMYREHLQNPAKEAPPGSRQWCAARMGFLQSSLLKYRFLTEDRQYDDLLQGMGGYGRFFIEGDTADILEMLRSNTAGLRYNLEGFTSEVRFTDRVLAIPRWFLHFHIPPEPPHVNTGVLYSMVTGEIGSDAVFPLRAVRWHTDPRELAVMVTLTRPDRFKAQLYHFGQKPRTMEAEFFMLEPGAYDLMLTEAGEKGETILMQRKLRIDERQRRVRFDLIQGKLCQLSVIRDTDLKQDPLRQQQAQEK